MLSAIWLPNGQKLTVSPVFGGLFFKADSLNTHQAAFPPGWTIILQSEEEIELVDGEEDENDAYGGRTPRKHVHRFRTPTLHNDAMYISSISNPASSDFKPATSQTRQIAMMLWATLYYYFHQPPPSPYITAGVSPKIPEIARPKGEWAIQIRREGIFKGRHLMQKLERMGLIASRNSYVGSELDDRSGEGWNEMFVTQRAFWQIDPRIYLFTLSPTQNSPYPTTSPFPSRPGSPSREAGGGGGTASPRNSQYQESIGSPGLWSPTTPGPFSSTSHLPTYYPPAPTQWIMADGVRHPLRPKPPRQGETFYTRHIPRFDSFLSFRVASLSPKALPHTGPVHQPPSPAFLPPNNGIMPGANPHSSLAQLTSLHSLNLANPISDVDLLHTWMNNPRVSAAWGVSGGREVQEAFLKHSLESKHSFPAIGCWDGKPFGYFEIYWAKEDQFGRYVENTGNWDRGIHVLIGEEEFRGKERVRCWLSALVHWAWVADLRTERVVCEPRVDNERFIEYLQESGFFKEREIAFPFKQAALMKIKREAWVSPAI
ncbi:hypothetical protein MMC25_006571 [Agyrium rufum]|nr:hypothetical protein [Agyrium rufum]